MCFLEKDYSEFPKRKLAKNGIRNECKSCYRVMVCPSHQKQKSILKNYVYEYLQNHSCIDCGEINPIVLEFDHIIHDSKNYNICYMVCSKLSLEKLKYEISLCEVRCANCHRIKTAKESNYWILDYI